MSFCIAGNSSTLFQFDEIKRARKSSKWKRHNKSEHHSLVNDKWKGNEIKKDLKLLYRDINSKEKSYTQGTLFVKRSEMIIKKSLSFKEAFTFRWVDVARNEIEM